MPSIRHVAELAGVSLGTVSRALRGQPGVAPATRHRVQDAARQLGYVASPLAGRKDARARLLGGRLLEKRVDAAVFVTLDLNPLERQALRDLGRPVALVGGNAGFPSVSIDDVHAGYTATRHLLELGHRRIAFVGVDRNANGTFLAAGNRRRGYRRALLQAGLVPDRALEQVADFTVASGRSAMETLMGLDDPPTAVFAASDEMAMGCLHAIRQAGFATPHDFSVVGVDDHEMAVLHDLTTVAQPVVEQGRIAAALLLDQLRGDTVAADTTVVVPTSLVVRATTGSPAGPRHRRDVSGWLLSARQAPARA
jgi:DNA-binding LacI/PurR family transcriptional regulator